MNKKFNKLKEIIKKYSLIINLLLLTISLLICYFIAEAFFALWEMKLTQTMGIFVPVDPRYDGAAWEVDPNQAHRFVWQPDGNSIIHIRSKNKKLLYELRPNAEISQIIKINSHGFRDYEYPLQKPPNTFRIAVVGDSVTFGWRQRLEDTYPKVLETLINSHKTVPINFEVLNFGIGGYNAEQEAEMIQEKVLQFKPDLIIIGFCPNDGQIGFDGGLWWHFFRGRSRTISFFKLLNLYLQFRKDPLYILRPAYTKINNIQRETSIPIIICILPMLQGEKPWCPPEFLPLLEELNLRYFNLVPLFDHDQINELMIDTVHLSNRGHQFVAEHIFNFLTKNNLIPLHSGEFNPKRVSNSSE